MATVNGSSGDDSLVGTTGADALAGFGGNDTIAGGDGADTFLVGDDFGNDIIVGGEGAGSSGDFDTLDLSATTTGVTVDLSAAGAEAGTFSDGTATASFSEIENIVLGGGRDTVVLADGSGARVLTGFDPSDFGDGTSIDRLDVSGLTDASGNPVNTDDVIIGDTIGDGSGDAILIFPDGTGITLAGVPVGAVKSDAQLEAMGIPAAAGSNYIVEGTTAGDLIDTAWVGDPDGDRIDNNDAADGSNDDYIEAKAGDDTILSGEGNDSVIADLGHDGVDSGAGDDTVRGGVGNDTITGGTGDDSLFGNEDNDSILAGDGADSVYGELGDDYIDGGAGDDHLEGNEGADTIIGGDGNDWIRGSFDDDEIWGGSGDDYLWGGFGDDLFVIEDDFGNDTIDAEGVDELFGDTLDLSLVSDDLIIDLTHVNPETGSFSDGAATAVFDEIETIILGGGRDTIVLADFGGADRVQGFDPSDSGDGTSIDRLDVSGLTSDGGTTPVTTDDVTVGDDGAGNAVLGFPGGESITLVGVAPAQLASAAALEAIGLPAAPGAGPDYTVEGTAGADLINTGYLGDPEGDRIDNNDAADGSNDDHVLAGDGDDSIDAGLGDDTVLGGSGDDEFFLDNSIENDVLIGGETGEDGQGDRVNFSTVTDDVTIIFSAEGAGTLSDGVSTTAFSEIEEFQMGTGNDSVVGSEGAEDIIGNYGADTILGNGGDDTIFSGFDGDSVDGGSGNDLLWTSSGADTVAGGSGDDQIDLGSGDGEADLVIMADGDGDDVVSSFEAPVSDGAGGWIGLDQLDVSGLTDASGNPVSAEDVAVSDSNGDGSGHAILSFPGGESIALVGVGIGQVQSTGQLVAMGIPASAGDFYVEGTAGADLIDAAYVGDPEGDMVDNNDHSDGSNDDYIQPGAGNDTVFAGAGDDTVHAGSTADANLIFAGDGNDVVNGGSGADTIFGGAGDDYLLPTSGEDQVYGEDGNDTLTAGIGSALLDGGAGNDSIQGGGISDRDTIIGGSGDDTLDDGGGDGLFVFADGFGNDLVIGGESGETNGDAMDFSAVSGNIGVIFSGDEAGSVNAGADGVSFSQIEQINLGAGNDSVDAAASGVGTEIWAGAGNDSFAGGGGDDTVFGFDGADVLAGGGGADWLDGDAGADLIDGGVGADTLIGDAGADSLTGGMGADLIHAGDDGDIITLAEGDTVHGQGGDDLFLVVDNGEAGANNATIVGGEADETLGDTLDFRGLTHWDDVVYTNTDPDAGGGMSGHATLADGSVVTFSEIENVVICFTHGTRIATATGPREVQDLAPGDLVVTRDHGLQPIRWVGSRTVPAQGSLAPVRFETGVLGNDRPLLVSPQHRMLIGGHRTALLFGESEVLASAKHLENGGSIARQRGGMVTYVHILFDRHEIVYAEGAPSESFFPGGSGLSAVEEEAREELFTLFPELRASTGGFEATARMCLRGHESRLLRLR